MITKEQAIRLAESKFWEGMSYREIAEFQMMEKTTLYAIRDLS